MLSRVIYWMICSLLVWLCSACCRSETYYVDQEVKDFTVFQPGSWWVYVDSVSGRRDSIVLTKLNTTFHSDVSSISILGKCENRLEYINSTVETYTWVNGSEYVRINPNDEIRNDEAYDIHDLLRFCRVSIDVKWNETNIISTQIGPYERSVKRFMYYTYGDTIVEGIKQTRISTNFFNQALGYEGTVIVKRIGLVQHTDNNHKIYLVNNYTTQ